MSTFGVKTRSRHDKSPLLPGLVNTSKLRKRRTSSVPSRREETCIIDLSSLLTSSSSSSPPSGNLEEHADQQPPPPSPAAMPSFFAVDPSLAPKTFSGTEENADEWLQYFNRYSSFRHFDNPAKCGYFSILLRSTAADWFEALNDSVKTDFAQLETSFKTRFVKSDLTRWKNADKLLTRVQKNDESVDQFITDVVKLARSVPVTDETFIRYAIIRGLKPEIRLHVIQKDDLDSMEKLQHAARVAELAQPSTSPSSEVMNEILAAVKATNRQSDENAAELQRLSSRFDKLSVNTAADRRSPSATPPTTRRVQFQDSRNREDRRPNFYRRREPQQQGRQGQGEQQCPRCLLQHPFGQCMACNAICRACGCKGHYARTHANYTDNVVATGINFE